MEKKIFVYEDFSSAEPQKLGVLYVDSLRGTEHYSFEYDEVKHTLCIKDGTLVNIDGNHRINAIIEAV